MLKELFYREYDLKPFVKSNYKIYRRLIMQNLSKYVCVWRKLSPKPIFYECGRLYANNFRQCFRIPFESVNCLPIVYELNTSFEEGICCTTQLVDVEKINYIKHAWSFIGITKQNWLLQLKWSNGELMNKIYLSSLVRFKHISWETEGETLVVKSKLNQRNKNSSCNSEWFLCAFAFFGPFPFRFLGAMKVKAADFGENIDNAYVMDQLLFISFRQRCVRLYSLKDVFNILSSRSQSDFQFNVNFSTNNVESTTIDNLFAKPTCLTEINCQRSNLMIGGFPWSSMTMFEEGFKVSILNSSDFTIINQSNNSIEEDNVMFHPNGSNRIIHQTTTKLRVIKPMHNFEERSLQLTNLYEINYSTKLLDQAPKVPLVTRSGRKVKSTMRKEGEAEIDTRMVLAFAYEHNLELIGVLFTLDQTGSRNPGGGELKLYDDNSGQYLSSIHLPYGFWDEDTQHVIDIDMDVIYHMSRSPKAVFVTVYRFINDKNALI